MNRRDLPTLLADLDDLALRCKDAGVTQDILSCLGHARDGLYLLSQLPERESVPPVWEDERPSYAPRNAETRKTATEHFRKAREYAREATEGINQAVRRIRRES